MNAAEVLLRVRRLVHLSVIAGISDDIYQKFGAHHEEIIGVGHERDGDQSIGVQDEDEGPAFKRW